MNKQNGDKDIYDKGDEDMENVITRPNNNMVEGIKDAIQEMKLMRMGLKEEKTLDELLNEIKQELEESEL